MKKRLLCIVLMCMLALSVWIMPANAEFDPESISTPYICLMDKDTGKVLFERSSGTQAFPASTTKIMTCILAIESGKLNEPVTVGDEVKDGFGSGSSLMGLVRRETIPLIDLCYGMMLRSGNDAAAAIGVYVGGSISGFADMMNAKARELGMMNTNFVNPHGKHNDEHKTTAYDMALLASYAMKNETFRTIVGTAYYDVPPTDKDSDGYQLYNSNRLICTKEDAENIQYQYATGIKTGDTANAGRCLVASAMKDGRELILVLFGDYEGQVASEYRFHNAASIFDWAFENFTKINASELGLETSITLPVANASFTDPSGGELELSIDLDGIEIYDLTENIARIKENSSLITTTQTLDRTLAAPIAEGEVLGIMTYMFEGSTLFTANLVATRAVAEIGATPDASDPSTSPIIAADTTDLSGVAGDNDGGSGWLFWVLIAVVVLIIVIVIRIIMLKRSRRYPRRRRRNAARRR